MVQVWPDLASTMPDMTQVLFGNYNSKQAFPTGSLHMDTPWWQKDFFSISPAQPYWLASGLSCKGRCSHDVQALVRFLAESIWVLHPAAQMQTPAYTDVPRCSFIQGCGGERFEFSCTVECSASKDPVASDEKLQTDRKFKTFVPLKNRATRSLN